MRLRSKNAAKRQRAIQQLTAMLKVSPGDHDGRAKAAIACLCESKAPEALDCLLLSLENLEDDVVVSAFEAVGKFRERRAITRIAELLAGSRSGRRIFFDAAIRTLDEIDEKWPAQLRSKLTSELTESLLTIIGIAFTAGRSPEHAVIILDRIAIGWRTQGSAVDIIPDCLLGMKHAATRDAAKSLLSSVPLARLIFHWSHADGQDKDCLDHLLAERDNNWRISAASASAMVELIARTCVGFETTAERLIGQLEQFPTWPRAADVRRLIPILVANYVDRPVRFFPNPYVIGETQILDMLTRIDPNWARSAEASGAICSLLGRLPQMHKEEMCERLDKALWMAEQAGGVAVLKAVFLLIGKSSHMSWYLVEDKGELFLPLFRRIFESLSDDAQREAAIALRPLILSSDGCFYPDQTEASALVADSETIHSLGHHVFEALSQSTKAEGNLNLISLLLLLKQRSADLDLLTLVAVSQASDLTVEHIVFYNDYIEGRRDEELSLEEARSLARLEILRRR